MAEDLPPVGSAVNLRWRGRWVTAHVAGHRVRDRLDLVADGVPRNFLLGVDHCRSGWMRLDEIVLDWKQRHANDSETATEHELVLHAVRNIADNLGIGESGIAWNALLKVAQVSAQVARAQALGFDPALLRLTAEEADDDLVRRAAEIVLAGVPVHVIGL